jgi:hypothetical protein
VRRRETSHRSPHSCLTTGSASLSHATRPSDPYLNVDAGTMSPFEHGEVFVLDDGGEVSAASQAPTQPTTSNHNPLTKCFSRQAKMPVLSAGWLRSCCTAAGGP